MAAPPTKSSSGSSLGALGIASTRAQNGAPASGPPTHAHSPSSQHMFAVNCLSAVASALAARPCARVQAERVAAIGAATETERLQVRTATAVSVVCPGPD
eukprot:1160507-Pelagomonas_calceolata.AAC.1